MFGVSLRLQNIFQSVLAWVFGNVGGPAINDARRPRGDAGDCAGLTTGSGTGVAGRKRMPATFGLKDVRDICDNL